MKIGSQVSEAHPLDPLVTTAPWGVGTGLSEIGDLLGGSQEDLSAMWCLMLGEDSLLFPDIN